MEKSSHVTVIFVEKMNFSPLVLCHLLYGRENFDRNGCRIIFVEDVVPVLEDKHKQTSSKYPLNADLMNSKNSKCGFGFAYSGGFDREMFEILTQDRNMSSFCVLAVPAFEIFPGKFLLLLDLVPGLTPACSDISNFFKIEVRIVCLRRGLNPSKLSWLHSLSSCKVSGTRNGLRKHNLYGKVGAYQEEIPDGNKSKTCQEGAKYISAAKLLILSLSWFFGFIQPGFKFLITLKEFLCCLPKYLFVAKQLSYRFNQVYNLFMSRLESPEQDDLSSKSVTNGNLIVSLLVDIILGLSVVYFVFSNQHFLQISSWLIGQKYNIAEHLSSLLKWLMGAPAGLKLNIPLNQFLGNFYIYHVHLWTSYLYFIEAYLPKIILCCTLAGCFGVTFLLALLCDVLLLLTVHIYCFYIYAARLFCLETHVLASLLRLFTGKKWNFLRSRVDSVGYDVDRLFIGTLLFTILLFLFPTVFLYYIVFTSLRLLVLLVQSCLYGVVALLNSFPFFGLWLYLVNQQKLPGQIVVDTKTVIRIPGLEDYFTIENVHIVQPESCIYLSFTHKCVPCGTLFKHCRTVMFQTAYEEIFGKEMFSKLLTGQIISKP